MKILSIESSCDETGAAVVEKKNGKINVLSNVTATSSHMHAKTGGIIPENAAREQIKAIIPVLIEALIQSNLKAGNAEKDFSKARDILKKDIDSIAVTYGPGLIGSLLIGVETIKTLSFALDKPIVPVNHLLAHIYANFINREEKEIKFPFIGLIVSGGHTDLLLFKSPNDYKWLGGTRDDAAGEAIDKIGRMLGLSYPAGPEMEKRANLVTKSDIKFQSPLLHSEDFDFSFSGLKSESMRFVKANKLNEKVINQICYATQSAIIKVLIKKTLKAVEEFDAKQILIGGGVSANNTLRKEFEKQTNTEALFPEKEFCTDNAAMIGAYALVNGKREKWENIKSNPELYFA